jgi:DNA-binding MarR family transcriptional regulator
MAGEKTQIAVERMARECVGNQLRVLNRVVTGLYEDELRPLKLTASQMVILAFTARGGHVRPVELCRALQLDASTVSRNLERMRARGWLEKVKDERSRPFRLTTSGKKMVRNATAAWQRAQTKAVDVMGEKGVALLRRISRDLTAGISPD